MRRVKQLNKTQRSKKKRRAFELNGYKDSVSIVEFKKIKEGPNPRLCGNLSEFRCHANGIVKQGTGGRGKGALTCVVCNTRTYTSCGLCLTAQTNNNDGRHPTLCFFPSKGPNMGKSCFLDYHNDCCFGLARRDFPVLLGKRKSEWSQPSEKKKRDNAKYIRKIVAEESEATSH